MKRWLWILLVIAWPTAADAEKVVVYSTGGPGGGKISKLLLNALKTQLVDHKVVKKKRPRKWKKARKLAPMVGKAARKARAAIGVDSHVETKGGRALVVLAVDTEGGIVLAESLALPKNKKEAKSSILGLGRRLAGEINARLGGTQPADVAPAEPAPAEPAPAETNPQPAPTVTEFDDGQLDAIEPIQPLLGDSDLARPPAQEEQAPPPPPMAEQAPVAIENPDFLSGGPVDLEEAAMLQLDATDKRKRRVKVGSRDVHLTVRAGAGAAGYDDQITTPVAGGDLVRRVGATFQTSFGFELEAFRWFELTIDGHRNASKMVLQGVTGTGVIRVSELGAIGQLGATFDLGPVRAGVRAGAAFDVSGVGDPVPGLTLPTWNRLLVLGGLVVGYGNHGADGITVQLGALYAPWGLYNEDPVTSGDGPSYAGGLAWLRVRYQLPVLFGLAGGLFFEVAGNGEYIMATFDGVGTRQAPSSGLAVRDAEQTRFGWASTASVGYVY